jgi:hypothetical protein
MRLRGITIRGVLLAVVVAAIDCAIVRSILARGEQAEWLLAIVVGAMPFATILAVGLLVGLRGRRHSFWVGFEFAGGIALLAFVAAAYSRPNQLDSIIEPVLDRIGEAISRQLGVDLLERWDYTHVEMFVILPLLVTVPLAAVATAGGLLARWLRVRIVFERFAGRPRRPALALALWLLVFFALPGVGIEGFLRRTIDPYTTRLGEGKVAVLDASYGNGFSAPFEDGTSALLPNGTRFRVDYDDQPASTQPMPYQGRGQAMDMRSVNVTVLDGDAKGQLTVLPRCFLRPLR